MADAPVVPESHLDLLHADVAVLTTNGADGLPQVTAVCFLHSKEDGLIRLSLNDARQKTKNLRRDSKATLFILAPDNPYKTLELRGTVELTPDPDFAFAAEAGAKYNQDFRLHDQPGETRSVVTFHPSRINAINIGG
jgi:PPOX class probable F420-dependent enzyme